MNRDLENWVKLVDGVDELREVAEQLEPHARTALLRIARRFLAGQKQYGTLMLDNDKQRRDFIEEATQEAADKLAYLEFWLIQQEMAKHG